MKRLFKIIAAIAILITVPKIIQAFMGGGSNVAAEMSKMVAQTNKDLPRRIDQFTTLTRAEFTGKVFRVHYGMDPGVNIDPARHDQIKAYAVKQICGSDMKRILDKGIAIEYHYTYNPDGRGEQQMDIAVPTSSCV